MSMQFELTEQQCPVGIKNLKGELERYLLVEADGIAGTEYRNAASNSIKFNAQGKPSGTTDIATAQLVLVAKCLWRLLPDNEDGTLKKWIDPEDSSVWFKSPVNIELVRSWPDRVSQALFDKARELSGMEDEKNTAKNS